MASSVPLKTRLFVERTNLRVTYGLKMLAILSQDKGACKITGFLITSILTSILTFFYYSL